MDMMTASQVEIRLITTFTHGAGHFFEFYPGNPNILQKFHVTCANNRIDEFNLNQINPWLVLTFNKNSF